MTREDIIRMAREAGLPYIYQTGEVANLGLVERFAALVAAAALAEPTVPSDCADSHQPVAWYHVPYPGSGISPMVSLSQQREPSMYGAVVPLYLKEQL